MSWNNLFSRKSFAFLGGTTTPLSCPKFRHVSVRMSLFRHLLPFSCLGFWPSPWGNAAAATGVSLSGRLLTADRRLRMHAIGDFGRVWILLEIRLNLVAGVRTITPSLWTDKLLRLCTRLLCRWLRRARVIQAVLLLLLLADMVQCINQPANSFVDLWTLINILITKSLVLSCVLFNLYTTYPYYY